VLVLAYAAKTLKLMKTSTNTRVILKAIDLKLKALLTKDLQHFRTVQENKQASIKKAA
jgi:hypothetical protein